DADLPSARLLVIGVEGMQKLLAEGVLERVDALVDRVRRVLDQRRREARLLHEPDSYLRGTPRDHPNLADCGLESRVAHAELVAALLQSQASPALVQRGEGGHERVLEREDFDGGVGHGLGGPSVLDDRDHFARRDGWRRDGKRRRELDSYLRGLPRGHLNLAPGGCELRMAPA